MVATGLGAATKLRGRGPRTSLLSVIKCCHGGFVSRPLKGATAAETYRAILDLIRPSGVVSRIELADRSGLPGASTSRIVKQLLAAGLILETGFGDSTGGRGGAPPAPKPPAPHSL